MAKKKHPAAILRRFDPTRTTGLRQRFMADMARRWNLLKSDIFHSIVDRDCFGIQYMRPNEPEALTWTPEKAYAFERDMTKIVEFMKWLDTQEQEYLLRILATRGILRPESLRGIYGQWTDEYIRAAYTQGIRRARAEMKKAGIRFTIPGVGDQFLGGVASALYAPIHIDTIGVLYMRVFEDLKTVLAATNATVRRIIADELRTGITLGYIQGRSPIDIGREVAKAINSKAIDAIGKTRSQMIARTEIARAHHAATIEEYRQAQAEMKVTLLAEFSTAANPCPECQELARKGPYTLDEAAPMIPVHPNCRCALVPYIEKAKKVA